jgi:hypothetical protein
LGLSVQAQERLTFEPVYDFGHVGLDYKVFHDFWIHNPGDKPVKITKIDNNCDCTGVALIDSVIMPEDSVAIMVTFETKNFYGPTNKSLKVHTDHPQQPEIQLFYLSIIGQWYDGVRPDPHSLFFLPGQKSKEIAIPNPVFDELEFVGWNAAHPGVTVEAIEDTAGKGGTIKLRVDLIENGTPQTARSSLTLQVKESGGDHSFILTLPVKVARF